MNPSEKPSSGGQTLLTIMGESAKLTGDFVISRSIEIDCEVYGKLEVQGQLIIQKNGFVKADVKTEMAEVIGRFEGTLEAKGCVEIKETGYVSGNIKTDSLIINKGGIFSGSVERMSDIQPHAAASVPPAGKKATDPLKDREPVQANKLTL